MDSWIVDADQIAFEQTGTFEKTLFHRNYLLDNFMDEESKQTLVVAPNGYGKTLLLKAKRASLSHDFTCFPKDLVIDRPTGVPNLSKKEYGDTLHSDLYWKTL